MGNVLSGSSAFQGGFWGPELKNKNVLLESKENTSNQYTTTPFTSLNPCTSFKI
jgi:hypothetical protein